jgi:hypothetical protein
LAGFLKLYWVGTDALTLRRVACTGRTPPAAFGYAGCTAAPLGSRYRNRCALSLRRHLVTTAGEEEGSSEKNQEDDEGRVPVAHQDRLPEALRLGKAKLSFLD